MCYNWGMKKKILAILASLMIGVGAATPAMAISGSCPDKYFLGMDAWYNYLDCDGKEVAKTNFEGDNLTTAVWLIVLTVLKDLFFAAGVLAVVYIIVAGIQFILSGGDPANAAKAKKALTATVVGLVIVLVARVIVNTILKVIG